MSTPQTLLPSTFEQTMFEAGEIQGNYLLEGLMAQRDFSEVYRGTNIATGQLVAVKFARDYEPGGVNPIALEASIHKKVSGLPGIVPLDGADIFGLNGDAPYLATELQERGTFSKVLDEEEDEAGVSPRSVVLQQMERELEVLVTSHGSEEMLDPDMFQIVQKTAAAQGIPDELAHAEIDPDVKEVVEVIVDVAEQRFGKGSLDPSSITAQFLALDVVKAAATTESAPHEEIPDVMKEPPSREEIERRLHILGGVAAGYAALHEAGYIQRDGKPSNYYVGANGNGMLGDFSAAVKDGYVATRIDVSSPGYMAPEEGAARIDVSSPGYMAPEEGAARYAELVNSESSAGGSADALRSVGDIRYTAYGDMYKFISVVLESVTGVRPYPISTVKQKREMLNPYFHEPRGLDRLAKAPIERDVKHMLLRGMSTQMYDRGLATQAANLLSRY